MEVVMGMEDMEDMEAMEAMAAVMEVVTARRNMRRTMVEEEANNMPSDGNDGTGFWSHLKVYRGGFIIGCL